MGCYTVTLDRMWDRTGQDRTASLNQRMDIGTNACQQLV